MRGRRRATLSATGDRRRTGGGRAPPSAICSCGAASSIRCTAESPRSPVARYRRVSGLHAKSRITWPPTRFSAPGGGRQSTGQDRRRRVLRHAELSEVTTCVRAAHNSRSSPASTTRCGPGPCICMGIYGAARENIEAAARSAPIFIASYVTEADRATCPLLILIAPRRPPATGDSGRSGSQPGHAGATLGALLHPDNFRLASTSSKPSAPASKNRVGEAISGLRPRHCRCSQGRVHPMTKPWRTNWPAGFWLNGAGFAASHFAALLPLPPGVVPATGPAGHVAGVGLRPRTPGRSGRNGPPARGASVASTRVADSLDLDRVVSAAHLIAAERNPVRLRRKHIALANAGADRGFLILDVDAAPW